MHREYRPEDLNRLRSRAFGAGEGHDHHHHDHGHPHHSHAHDHEPHEHDERSLYFLTALMGLLLGGDLIFGWLGWDSLRAPFGVSLTLAAALIGGLRIVYGAIDALLHGQIGADVALAQACVAALLIGQPFVAAEVVFIALVGEVLEALTFSRTQHAIHRLLDQTPRTARVRRDGMELEIPAGQVIAGDLVIVRPGERVPVDGPVVVGRTSVDQSPLTGESIPVDKGPGEPVYTGTLNQFGLIEVRAEKVGHETTLGQVLRMVADAQKRKAPLERVADRMARYFLPVVEVVAGLTLLFGYVLGWPDVWFRTVAVLVVACPCALILATPAAMLAAMAWLARHGVLIKGGVALERLAACDVFAFDKTGTLTHGRPEIASLLPLGGRSEEDVLSLAATAEASSQHPLALAVLREAERRGASRSNVREAQAHPGAGVSVRYHEAGDETERLLVVGNRRLLVEQGIPLEPETEKALEDLDARGETPLLVALDGLVVGLVGARDTVRPEAHDVVHDLKHLKIREVALLTGDRASAARPVAKKTHIKTVEAELLPADKARWVEERQSQGRKVAMVGDGINDAPALAAAHVGIALGAIGADLAAEAGDIVVLGEPLRELPELVGLSRATVSVIRQNIVLFAFGLNAVAMGSAALGILGPVPAAILHQAGSLLVLLNAMRLLVFGEWTALPPFRQLRSLGASIRRLDDRLDPGHAIEGLIARWSTLARVAVVAGFLWYSCSGWTAIGPDEVGLLQQFGRYAGKLGPGLHLRWPFPFETVTRLRADQVRSMTIGFRTGASSDASSAGWAASHGRGLSSTEEEESLLLTGDGHVVELAASTQYRLDPTREEALRAFAFGVSSPEDALRSLAESSVRQVVGRSSLESLLTSGRSDAERDAAELLQSRIDRYGLGLRVNAVTFQEVHPPIAVVDAYRDVSRAESDRQRRRNEAAAYLAEALADARGRSEATRNRAKAGRTSLLERIRSETDSFRYLAEARAGYPVLTDLALYWDTIARTLAGKPKVLLDPGRGSPRHLVVPEVGMGSFGPAEVPALVGPPRPTAGRPAQ